MEIRMKEIQLTESEINTLKFYLEMNLIDARGDEAIGIGSKATVKNLESIKKKITK